MAGTFTVETDIDDIKLRRMWAAGMANPKMTLFHSWAWLRAWCAEYRDFDQAEILVAYVSEKDFALLPMMSYQGVLRTMSYNSSDYAGTIFPVGATLAPGIIADYLRSERRPVVLWNVRDDDPVVVELTTSGHVRMTAHNVVHQCDLGASTVPSARVRRDIARNLRRLAQLGATITLAHPEPADVVGTMVAIHTERWRALGLPGNFGDPRRARFIRRLIDDPSIPSRVAILSTETELLAYRISFTHGSTIYAWNCGMNVEYRQFSPGTVLQQAEIDRARLDGFGTYDFLRGNEPYKYRWSTSSAVVYEYRVDR